jgi:hypothetical protein
MNGLDLFYKTTSLREDSAIQRVISAEFFGAYLFQTRASEWVLFAVGSH